MNTLFKVILFVMIAATFMTSCTGTHDKDEDLKSIKELTQFVNPFIGTAEHGHTFPGASLPFGMVQLSPDTRLEGWDGCSGYHYSDSIVYGFSHTHLSGTGVPDYCDILFMPTTGLVQLDNGAKNPDEGYSSRFSHENEKASPGFYSTFLDDHKINVELTATKRVGFHKYTFPGTDTSNIIIDLTHRDKVIGSQIKFVSDHEIEGYRRSTGWANDQIIYFVAEFSKPFLNYGIESNGKLVESNQASGNAIKAFVRYSDNTVEEILVKVGVSAVSTEGARKNLLGELAGWDFDQVKNEAKKAWNDELNKIVVESGSEKQKTTFYTALYHAFLVPNLFMDIDRKYRGRDFQIHQAEGFDYYTVFSLWDTFRGEHPLFTIIQQKRTIDFIKTMIAQFEQGGRLPVWELAANETECMIGYHSIPVIVDAYVKGIRDFDAEKAFEAMKYSADLDHFGLKPYREFGYIPAEDEAESVSKTLEYAYDDWCIAIMAKALGKTNDYERFIGRAQSYKNIFDPLTGLMRAKMNGMWFTPFDPREVNFNYTEANSWQYSFFVPQDINGLIKMMGGKEKFAEKLDDLFSADSETTGRDQSDITGMIGQYAHGNEPSHHMAYLYNYAGEPWKTQKVVRQIMDRLYSDQPDGLCGNEDCGQMSAWYVLSAIGFYPALPGNTDYTIGSPLFDKVTINLENGKSFTIENKRNSPHSNYIQSANLNGKKYMKSFITQDVIINGGSLVFVAGDEPNKTWGTGEGNNPVSEITDNLIMPVPYIEKGKRTFIDTTMIALGSAVPGSVIYFTTDGTDPHARSATYSEPFTLSESTTLKVMTSKEGMPESRIIKAEFYKIPAGRTIKYNTQYAPQYFAGGNLALIDYIRGPLNFRTGAWQGYEGVDLHAIIDLGSIQLISEIEAGFLQDVGAWIFFPEKVDFYTSTDEKDFQHVGTVKSEVSLNDRNVQIKYFGLNFNTKARYIRVVAKNIGVCPEWHWGAGGKAWIFTDEIVIK